MKGFLYLVEIAVAAVLAALILGSFFAVQTVGTSWDRADLIGLGNNIFDILGNDSIKVLNETDTYETIYKLMPSNVRYTMHFRNVPKDVITIGTNDRNYFRPFLQDSYINNRWIKYDLIPFDITENLNKYDILLLHDYDYTGDHLSKIETFSETKTIIGLESSGSGFEDFYDVNDAGTVTSTSLNFNEYNNIANYFLGIGFIVDTPNYVDIGATTYRWGEWKIKNDIKIITASSIEICYNIDTCGPNVGIREKFGTIFFLKKIDWFNLPPYVFISIKDTNFGFQENWGSIDAYQANEDNNRIIGNSEYSTMTKHENRIWVAEMGTPTADLSSEYYTLVQAAVASSVTDWYTDETKGNEITEVSRFVPLCCDMTEIAEIAFSMWYVF